MVDASASGLKRAELPFTVKTAADVAFWAYAKHQDALSGVVFRELVARFNGNVDDPKA